MRPLAVSLLTDGSWPIQCWTNRFDEDTRDICQCEAAFGRLPSPIRASIYDFACGDASKLHNCLCTVKRLAYHTLDQALFWHPPHDFQDGNDHDDPPVRVQLLGVYSFVTKYFHKPKLQSLKRSLVRHEHFIKRNLAMQKHRYLVRKAIELVDLMLVREIAVVRTPFAG